MRFTIPSIFLLMFAALVPLQVLHANEITFGTVVDALKPDDKTKVQLKEIWSQYHGKTVTWSGVLVEARERKHFTVLRVLDRSRKDYQGFNITVEVRNKDKAATLKKGQTVRFRGELDKFSHKSNGVTLIVVEHAEVL